MPGSVPSRALASLLCGWIVFSASPLQATWSVIAVDRKTGQIGIAGASCTHSVYGIGAIEPGRGAIIVQAMSNGDARERGMAMLRSGGTTSRILQAMRDPKFDPENQQYAVILLDPAERPMAYSGKNISGWSGAVIEADVSIQGNILTDAGVLDAAMTAFRAAASRTLPERLMAALKAGAEAGGDQRCGAQKARSAFVTVFNKDDARGEPWVNLVVYGIEKGGRPAVTRLEQEFIAWREAGTDAPTTRKYVIPGKSGE